MRSVSRFCHSRQLDLVHADIDDAGVLSKPLCGCASRNEKALSHQPGVVRQRPAFGHRLARIETARLEKLPANVLI
jgi:hypothetical protein